MCLHVACRAEKALMAALAEIYVQGVSTRKVKAITEVLIGNSFSASSVSAVVNNLPMDAMSSPLAP